MPTRERRARLLGVPIEKLPDTRGRHGNHARGRNAARWNRGRMISSDGYILIRAGKIHPLACPNGYAYEHLMVWCSAGECRRPLPSEALHHINGDRTDSRIENLALLPRSEHNRLHNAGRKRDKLGRFLPR